MLTFAAILVFQTEEIQKNHRLLDGYKTCAKRFDTSQRSVWNLATRRIWIDATGINWSSWLWVTTSTLSTKEQGRSHWHWNLHYIQPFNSHWPKNFSWIAACETQNNTNTWQYISQLLLLSLYLESDSVCCTSHLPKPSSLHSVYRGKHWISVIHSYI